MTEDQILEELELKNQPTFAHYVQAMGELVEDFREYLHEETDRMTRVTTKQLGRDYDFGAAPEASLDPELHAHLHRLKFAADNFMNALMGNY
jgi:hypothetical protein